jgi:TIR domain
VFWSVAAFPSCTHHVFLSHCREDHDDLVRPVYELLATNNISGWLDREDYHYGRDSRTALRDAILRSRHTVFFVTPALLATGRGWCVLELAYAELLQASLVRPGGALANVILPLFFVPQSDDALPRTVWQLARDRGRFCDAPSAGRADWAVAEIARFLRDEQRIAADCAAFYKQDKAFRKELAARTGLTERATQFDPHPLDRDDS